MEKRSRSCWLVVLMLVVALATGACGAPSPTEPPPAAPTDKPVQEPPTAAAPAPTEPPAQPEPGNILVQASPQSFPDLDPAASYSAENLVLSQCYETLTFYNPPGSAKVLGPKLATSWEASDDATEWTFHLREGIQFTDGEPLNAAAVKYAIEKTKEFGLGAAYMWDAVEEIEAVDELTVRFKLSYAAPLDLIAASGYAAWIYSPKTFVDYSKEFLNEGHCFGTGPYLIESYEHGSRLIMTRNEEYWGGWKEGQFDKVVFEIIEDPVVIQQKLEAGTVDFSFSIPPDNLAALEARDDVVVYRTPSFRNVLLHLNTQKPPLDNKLVRQALNYSFDYQGFVDGVLPGVASRAHGPIPAGMWGHSEELFQYDYNLDKAKALLTEAGYPDGGFDLLYIVTAGDLAGSQLGELWKADLAKLGINLEIQTLAWESHWDMCKSGPDNAQDIYIMHWWPDYISPIGFLWGMFHTEEETLFNCGYYSNPEFDQLIEAADAQSGTDIEAATEMFIQAQEMLLEDAVSLFVYDEANVQVGRADIKGFVDNPAYSQVVFAYQLVREK
jgi:peptide/nickel transport system substrate-binding protein